MVKRTRSDSSSTHWERLHASNAPSELVLIGYAERTEAVPLPVHQHTDEFEFVLLEKGHAVWEMSSGDCFESLPLDVFHTRPGEMHRGRYNSLEPNHIWWFHLKVPDLETPRCNMKWLELSEEESQIMVQRLWQSPRIVSVGPEAVRCLWRIRHAIDSTDSLSPIECRLALLEFLVLVLMPNQHSSRPRQLETLVEDITATVTKNPSWRPSVKELAERVNLSPSYFSSHFRSVTGLSPHAYLELIRIEEACKRLSTNQYPITDIAHDLGYTSSQYFATVFRRITGHSPSAWRGRGV